MYSKIHGPDYHLLSPDDLNEMLTRPIEHAIGKREVERLKRIMAHYDYYDGKQHRDEYGNFVKGELLDRPDGMDYDPSRYTTNYFKAFIKRKARWQMAGEHSVVVKPKSQKEADVKKAEDHQDLLYEIWKHNDLKSDKIRIARDRLIAGMIAAKIVFNPRTGRLHWIWHKATEVFPMYSNDGFNDFIGCDFIIPKEDPDDENKTQYWRQRFRLTEDGTDCTYEEKVYDEQLKVIETITEETPLGFPFVPVVIFSVNDLMTRDGYNDEVDDMITLTSKLNDMMGDATDSLKFEMFNITVVENAKPGTAAQLQIAPGAVVEITSDKDGTDARLRTVENTFQWDEAFKAQYSRIKAALHELSGLPQIVPQELNFGGLNDRALQVLYQDVIQETGEHWLAWGKGFKELHEKSVQYLQARTDEPNFAYDAAVVKGVEDYESEVLFSLPLPDDRSELVDLLATEVDNEFESLRGAQQRLGVENVEGKLREIREERQLRTQADDPYSATRSRGNTAEGNSDIVDSGDADEF